MDLRERLLRHRKDNRLILAALTVLLLLFTAAFYLLQRNRDLPAFLVANRVLLFVLWYANVVLILAVVFVLLRNLLKLVLERRHRLLGANFKFKLVATYVGLSLIPVLLLFAIATELLQGSVERWFNTPLKPVLEQGNAVAQALYDQIERTGLRDASWVLGVVRRFDLREPAERPRLTRRLERLLGELDLDVLAVYEGGEFVQAVLDPQAGLSDLPEPGRDVLEEAAAKGRATRTVAAPGGPGMILLTAVAAQGPSPGSPPPEPAASPSPASRPIVVVAGTLLDPVLSEQRQNLVEAYQSFRQLEVQKEDLRASHLLVFLMVTLLILLASCWVGLVLARRVTVPIQALAEGTRRISGGDLSHRVEVDADDELGVLVDSFNRMTEELQNNKELLEHGNRELVAANQRLDEERVLLAAVLRNVAAGVVSLDAAGRIFTCNGAALHILRQREDEVVGRRPEEAWGDPERNKLAALLSEVGEVGELAEGGHRDLHLILGGEQQTFEVKVTAMQDGAGGSLGRVVVIEDLTELIKAQQLAAWSDAARRVAHEIKNPLTPIRLAAERLLHKHRQGDPGLGKAIEEGVEVIVREVETLQGMVDEFSRFARMPRPRPMPVEVGRLVEEIVHLYRELKPGVEVTNEVGAGLAPIWLDREQIRRALLNLLDNAVEATEPPGRVEVAVQAVDGHLEIQVKDTGRGIPPAAREKLFLPYFSTKGRGTGLGLAIVHRIVSDHHGSIRVEDNRPKGTVFTLELPLQ
jgi:two-component system nitrogen regulation sensor histidine kinase NtrY